MKKSEVIKVSDGWIRSVRPEKNKLNQNRPYHFLIEKERSPNGKIEDIATIFLSNSECPFTCLMCDLWRNTLDQPASPVNIIEQIDYALSELPQADSVKLYNNGNFFDTRAISPESYPDIAESLIGFDRIIVESHPKLIGDRCFVFNEQLKGRLEVAMGLETSNPQILKKLNKSMELQDFTIACDKLTKHNIGIRSFVLLGLPFLSQAESIKWAKRSIEFSFASGVDICAVIPTRTGNGALDQLMLLGDFEQPSIHELEEVLDFGIGLHAGFVFADLWDIERFSDCETCLKSRKERIDSTNLSQQIQSSISCFCS